MSTRSGGRIWHWLLIGLTVVSVAAAGWSSWQVTHLSQKAQADAETAKGEMGQLRGELGTLKAEQERTKPRITTEEAAAWFAISRGGRVGPDDSPNITFLAFGGTDAELKQLAPLKHLTELYLGGDVTDEGLKVLAHFEKLTTLDLRNAKKVTDAGLEYLPPLNNLNTLYTPRMNDQTLTALRKTGRLHAIAEYAWTKEYKRPQTEKDVYRLQLRSLEVTDAGLQELYPLSNLVYLDLQGTGVTDAGLKALTTLSKLRSVHVDNTKVTEAGMAELRKALPEWGRQ